jgi:small subunit ribosomal protein S16
MLAIKLKRIGKKHQASFRLIVDEKRHKLYGKNIEDLGWHNPRQDRFEIKKDRVEYWLKNGAQPTDTVHNLLVRAGIIKGKKIPVHKKAKAKKLAAAEAKAGEGSLASAAPAA